MVAEEQLSVLDVSFSIGIATRRSGETFAGWPGRASQAIREVQLTGGGY
jgi:hypothetical protein